MRTGRYYLYDDQFTETVKQRYDANIKFLIGVASGDVKLGVDAESGVEPAAPAPSCTPQAGSGIAAREGFSDGSGHDPLRGQRGLDAALSRLAALALAAADLQGDRQLRRILDPPAL